MSAFKGWKKVSSEKDHSIMRNDQGHELKIAHSALSPKMRGHLAEIPVHKEDNKATAKAVQDNKGQIKLADGGQADPNKSWTQKDKQNFDKGATQSGQKDLTDAVGNVKKALGFAAGGMALPGDERPDMPPAPEPAPAVDPQQAAFDQRRMEIAKGLADTAHPSQMNMPPEEQPQQNLGQEATAKALDQMDSEKAAGAQAAASTAADQAAKYQQAVDINKRLQAQGLAPNPLPPAPAGGAPDTAQGAPTGQQSGLISSQGQPAPDQGDPYGIKAGGDMLTSGFNQQLSGIGAEAKATGALGTQEAKIQAQAATHQQQLLNDFQNHQAQFQAQSDEAVNALKDPKSGIDANHYMGSMDTGQRISTAIGLILGGIGGGVLGTENPALKMLNANIDRDIDAQKQNLGTKKSLLEYNLQKFRNTQEATMMTKGMMNDISAHNLQAAAAASQDPIAKARAMQAAGQLKQQAAQQFRQLAMQRTMMGGLHNGTVSPEMAVEYSPILDQKQRDVARKELKDMQDANAMRDNALGGLQQVRNIQKHTNWLNPVAAYQANKQIDAIKGPVLDKITKDTSGRVTPETVQLIGNVFSGKLDNDKTFGTQYQQADRLLSAGMHYPTLKILGISPEKYSRFGGQGGQASIPMRAATPNPKSK